MITLVSLISGRPVGSRNNLQIGNFCYQPTYFWCCLLQRRYLMPQQTRRDNRFICVYRAGLSISWRPQTKQTDLNWLKQLEQLRHRLFKCDTDFTEMETSVYTEETLGNVRGAVRKVHGSGLFYHLGLELCYHSAISTHCLLLCVWFVPLCHDWGNCLSGFSKHSRCWNTATT